MGDKIALYLQDDGNLASFLQAEKIIVYEKDGLWHKKREFPLQMENLESVAALRNKAREIMARLGDCKIMAGQHLGGAIYGQFDQNGFSIFDIDAYGPEVFDGILQDLKVAEKKRDISEEILRGAQPVETETPGVYELNLVQLQTECPEVSSKIALREFLKHTVFSELRLSCRHIPPWLEDGTYDIQSRRLPGGTIAAVLTKNQSFGGN